MKKYLSIALLCALTASAEYVVPWYPVEAPAVSASAPSELYSLRIPAVGDYELKVIATNMLELFQTTYKPANIVANEAVPLNITNWTFIATNGTGTLPSASDFVVYTNGVAIPATAVNYKRRMNYGSETFRDFRIGNWLYLTLASAIPTNSVVVVSNAAGTIWTGYNFTVTNSWTNISPAIHVNQLGYIPTSPKFAFINYYMGSGGELNATTNVFYLLNQSNQVVHSGSLTLYPDVGWAYTPTPYQKVWRADFSEFTTAGRYKVFVPGMGCSYPFWISTDVAAAYARTYALGMYHQRCGTNLTMPWSRFEHLTCHTNLAWIPTAAPSYVTNFLNPVLADEGDLNTIGDCFYPYLNQSQANTIGGHHDAGDYSKYTTSVAKFCHTLTFAIDSMPGVKHLDNLGIPESGDGISDVLQELKWEGDYLAKLQDSDGGFYFLLYPTNSQYEPQDPSTNKGQVLLPKNTSGTAAAVGALAEMASSPTFKAQYPATAASYLTKALAGWTFLTNAFAAHGYADAFQQVTFSGSLFTHIDDMQYAATALYLATTGATFHTFLLTNCPTPNSIDNRQWSWWSMVEGYGNAFRLYAFATNSGRMAVGNLNAAYLASCKAEIKFQSDQVQNWSSNNCFGTSLFPDYKSSRNPAWYFGLDWAFDAAVGYALEGGAGKYDTLLKNVNYTMGANPVNVNFVNGVGYKRQHETVNQVALYDDRDLPPTGIQLGEIKSGYDDLRFYRSPERENISYPADGAGTGPYSYYDRWEDTFNTTTEWVVSQGARMFASVAYIAALNGQTNQSWNSQTALLFLSTNRVVIGSTGAVTMTNTGSLPMTNALVTWEVEGEDTSLNRNLARTLRPTTAGTHRVEAEAMLPDGRRVFARTNFIAALLVTNNIEDWQSENISNSASVLAWWKLDSTATDNEGISSAMTLSGAAAYDTMSFVWTNRVQTGGAVRILNLGDHVSVSIPNNLIAGTEFVSIEAMMYINALKAPGQGHADMLHLSGPGSQELNMYQNSNPPSGADAYPTIAGNGQTIATAAVTSAAIVFGKWQHWKIELNATTYTVTVDGNVIATLPDANDYSSWSTSGNSTLTVGDFDGWIDEIVVK